MFKNSINVYIVYKNFNELCDIFYLLMDLLMDGVYFSEGWIKVFDYK